MACVPIPQFPPLPDILPLVLTPPTLPTIDLSVDLCCRLNLTIPLPIIPLGPLVLAVPGASAIILGINVAVGQVNAVISMLPLACPFD